MQRPIRWIKKIRNPRRLLKDLEFGAIRRCYLLLSPQATRITNMTWDNLIVLDGCRFDVFARYSDLPGKLVKKLSVASCTWNWIVKNFRGADLRDTIYISANPYVSYYYLGRTLGYVPFHKIVEVWKDNWNDELMTVHPSAVNQATLKVLDSKPHKRLLIHYLQPHHPFIGDVKLLDTDAVPFRDKVLGRNDIKTEKLDAFKLLKEGSIDIKTIWKAYISNLKLVLRHVSELLPSLTGKICITSDHGNTFGRYGVFYGHPEKTLIPELIEIPWLEYACTQRRH